MNQLFLDKRLQNHKLWVSEGSLPPTEAAKVEDVSNGCGSKILSLYLRKYQQFHTTEYQQTVYSSLSPQRIAEIANPYCSSNISDSKKEKLRKLLDSQGNMIEGVLILNSTYFSVWGPMKQKINEESIHRGCMNFKDLL